MERCRLCSGEASEIFRLPVLGKYDVPYYRCADCGSIQTEKPYWLGEVYGDPIQPEDHEYLRRNLWILSNVNLMLDVLKVPKEAVILDFGGGLGIIPRLLREYGRNAYNFDTYTASPFRDVTWNGEKPTMVINSELFEHLPNPAQDIEGIFQDSPEFVYTHTWRYRGEDASWPYFGPDHGGHVFFYTDRAMEKIAARFGYHVFMPNELDTIFSRAPLTGVQRRLIGAGFNNKIPRKVISKGLKAVRKMVPSL
ncbi:MAG: class I SAM-dependent methyltransferase [Candidatus Sphingomonas colombiensis]|nr:class I SAM-dependent methyltransferase [Sphingomonas sp.]WEK44963.1 MAG: class I SAM-dependent methyltransferase [Sphingomonas sp.]